MPVCSWCRAEIDGVGRSYHDTLEDAMRAFGCHVGTTALIRHALRSVTFDQIWLPYSGPTSPSGTRVGASPGSGRRT